MKTLKITTIFILLIFCSTVDSEDFVYRDKKLSEKFVSRVREIYLQRQDKWYSCYFPDEPNPLWDASNNGNIELCEDLIKDGADVNQPNKVGEIPLFIASLNGYLEICKLLIENGANVNQRNDGGQYYGFTPLHIAAMTGNIEIIKLLLENGADVNQDVREWDY